jgi:hypothetical protein
MLRTYLTRGVAAGVVVGVPFGLTVAVVGDPTAGGVGTDATLASFAVTGVAAALWSVLLGAVVFGAAHFLFEPLVPGRGAVRSYLLGAAGFVTVSGAPWLVLPPGVESALPAGTRVALYAGAMVAGAAACLLAGATYRRVRRTSGRRVALAAALVPLSLLSGLAVVGPVGVPVADLALPVVAGQPALWAALATVHAVRTTPRRPATTPAGD